MIMDRLPLVQALTAAGLERVGAEGVATALSDAIEASVATKADIHRLGSVISRVEAGTKADMMRLELANCADMHALETRLTLGLGGITVAAIGLLFVGLRYLGHVP